MAGCRLSARPQTIADQMEEWLTGEGCDGFNIMFPFLPAGLDDFVDKVVPELQRRGIFRSEYEGRTLRENLGLPRPKNRFLRVNGRNCGAFSARKTLTLGDLRLGCPQMRAVRPAPDFPEFEVLNMAKAVTIKVKLVSSADTGFYYVAKKNSRTMTDKLVKKKYDPVARKHVEFRESKIK